MPTPRAPQEGFSDSDQQWFDRLSGKPGPYDDAEAVREADALRLALDQERERLARAGAAAAADDEALLHEWQRLQFRVKREGVRPGPGRPKWMWAALGGVAATVLLSAGLLQFWPGPGGPVYDPPPVLRGPPSPVRQVHVPAPREAAERFADALRSAGLKPGLYQQDSTFVVDVNLLPEQVDVARPAFRQLGEEPPAVGLTRVMLRPR